MKTLFNSIITLIATIVAFFKNIFVNEKAAVKTDSIFEQATTEALEETRKYIASLPKSYATCITELERDIKLWSHDRLEDIVLSHEHGSLRQKNVSRTYLCEVYVDNCNYNTFYMKDADYWELELYARKLTGDPMSLELDVYWVIDPIRQKLLEYSLLSYGREDDPNSVASEFYLANDYIIALWNHCDNYEVLEVYNRKTMEKIGTYGDPNEYKFLSNFADHLYGAKAWNVEQNLLPTRKHYEKICSTMNAFFGVPDRDFKHGYRWSISGSSVVYIWDHTDCRDPYVECILTVHNTVEKHIKLTTVEDCEDFDYKGFSLFIDVPDMEGEWIDI